MPFPILAAAHRSKVAAGSTFDVSAASYASKSKSVAAQDSAPRNVTFKPDGTIMYVPCSGPNDAVFQYTLSTPWDVSTATYASKSFSVVGEPEPNLRAVAFKSDGTRMYVAGGSATNFIVEYAVATPWDLATVDATELDTLDYSGVAAGGDATGLTLSLDGTKLFIVQSDTTDKVHRWDLSTAWDLTTASYVGAFSLTQGTQPGGLAFSSDGLTLLVIDQTAVTVFQYTLSTPWDVSTAVYASKSFSVAAQDTGLQGLALSSDDTQMYTVGAGLDTVFQYDL